MSHDVLWFADRLGNTGNLASLWLRELNKAGVRPTKILTVSLHRKVSGQLLTRYANRQAPTWIPARAPAIKLAMLQEIRQAGPDLKAIVLCSPESLAILDLPADTATLGKLRGSVYMIEGIPAIVCLPMSAWLNKVSLKEVQNANFGAMSREGLERLYETEQERSADSDDTEGLGNQADVVGTRHGAGGNHTGNVLRREVDLGVGHESGNTRGPRSAVVRADLAGDVGDSFGNVAGQSHQGLTDADDDADLDDSDDDDKFFYVPVVVPVGKMMIQFDLAKLGRLVNGKAGEQWKPI